MDLKTMKFQVYGPSFSCHGISSFLLNSFSDKNPPDDIMLAQISQPQSTFVSYYQEVNAKIQHLSTAHALLGC